MVDADSGKTVGEVANLSGVHGIAIAADLGRGFISNGRASTVTIFDLKTPGHARRGQGRPARTPTPSSTTPRPRVFAFNGRSKNATVLDAKTGKVVGTIALGGKPEFATSDPPARCSSTSRTSAR